MGGEANIIGEMYHLWRAVGHEGEVMESYVTRKRYKSEALRLLKKVLKRHGQAEGIESQKQVSFSLRDIQANQILESDAIDAINTPECLSRIRHPKDPF